MTAHRYLLRLMAHARRVREWEENLDPDDDLRLREVLEREVHAEAGTLRLDLSDGWRLVVLAVTGAPRIAAAHVDGSGRTVVRR